MAFTSAAGAALNNYIKNTALKPFDFLGFQYEPQLIFQKQLREVVSAMASDYAKKNKNRRWLLVGYARTPLTYQLKRFEWFRLEGTENGLPASDWKVRQVHCTFRHVFVSPSPELLEELEELFVVKDLGAFLDASVDVTVRNPDKTVGPTYPFPFTVNLEKFNVENFDHLGDQSEGSFSIFTTTALTNYSVFVPDVIYDDHGSVEQIVLSIRYKGETDYGSEFSSTTIP